MLGQRIVICGSVRVNGDKMHMLAVKLKRGGFIVIEPYDVPFNRTIEPNKKSINMKFYYEAITNCDIVIVYSDNHIGFETACEIGYAIGCGKKLYFTHKSDIDGIKALLICEMGKILSDDIVEELSQWCSTI